ncbi:hypothetical protein FALCPG4_003491 [Fusarium falciforme]
MDARHGTISAKYQPSIHSEQQQSTDALESYLISWLAGDPPGLGAGILRHALAWIPISPRVVPHRPRSPFTPGFSHEPAALVWVFRALPELSPCMPLWLCRPGRLNREPGDREPGTHARGAWRSHGLDGLLRK